MKRLSILVILFLTLAGLGFTPKARAALLFNPNKTAEEHGKIVNDAAVAGNTNKEIYSDDSTTDYMNATTCKIMGCDSTPGHVYYYKNSSLASLGNFIAASYDNPPASLAYWVVDVGHDLGFLPKPVYAQGFGFTGFSALIPLWKVFRNIAYFLLALVMIVIGFMVMFRRKIDPKTVVTVQNALPRIVITLLLITFSYAIVGVLIDVMYLVMYLGVALFESTGLLPDTNVIIRALGMSTPQALYTQGGLLTNIIQAMGNANILKLLGITNVSPIAAGAGVGAGVLTILGLVLATAGTVLPAVAAGAGIITLVIPLLQFILSLALLFLFIRLLIFFVGAYIQVVIAMLFGPVQILIEAVPGTNAFASWIQNLIANLAVFPVGVVFFMLSGVFAKFADSNNAIWTPNLASVFNVSALNFNSMGISSLISLGILFAIPSVGGAIKEALKAKPFVNAGPEGVAGAFGQPIGILMQGYQMYSSHATMKAMQKSAALKGLQPTETERG